MRAQRACYRSSMRKGLMLVLAAGICGGAMAEMESWTNTEGREIQAELVEVKGEQVVLRLKGGKTVPYDIAKLDADGQKRVKAFVGFQEVAASAPKGVDPKKTSRDPEYGYSKAKPVKVGLKKVEDGPKAEREFLETLLDGEGKKVSFERVGSFGVGPDGHIIDGYEVTGSDGKKMIYIDMYHPECPPKEQLAPQGFWKK